MILLAIILLLAFATGEGLLHRLSYFIMIVIAASYGWAWLNLRRLEMKLEEQDLVAHVGDVLKGCIVVHNTSGLPTGWVEIGQMSDMPGHVCEGVTRLPARGWEEWRAEVYCHARGVYTVGPLMARSSDPVGLFHVQITRTAPVTVIIYPQIVELPDLHLPFADLSGEERALLPLQTRSAQASAVRQYNHGDSLNRIHWPSTARCGQLMSKEFDSPAGSDVWIILDLEQGVHRNVGIEKTDEYAVTITASLAHLALLQGRSVGLMAYGDREFLVPLGSGGRQMSRVLETLAWCKTEGTIPLADVLSRSNLRLDRFSSLLIVTPSTTTEWVLELHDLLCRGLTGAAVLVDPTSFEGEQSCREVILSLLATSIPSYIVRRGDAVPQLLSQQLTLSDLPISGQPKAPELTLASQPK